MRIAGRAPSGRASRVRALPGLVAGAPWWLSVVLGVLLAGAGLFLVARPLAALGVLGWYVGVSCVISGSGDLAASSRKSQSGPRSGRADPPRAAAWAWILVGVAILVWVGRDVDLLGPIVAILLVVSGFVALGRLVGDRSAERWLAALFGVAEIAFGLLALLWPDATLIIVAILFGGRTALFGLSLVWRGIVSVLKGRPEAPRPRGRWSLGLRWVGAALVLALAAVTLLVSHAFREGVPVADEFYDPPSHLPGTPGQLIRWEPYDGNFPDGMEGYRLLYVTTNAGDEPVLASAALAVPEGATDPAPLISWAHGTVGVARGCAPSIGEDAITDEGMPAMDSLARNGWAMVATDYPGMGADGDFPYLIGEGQGRAVLDAVRAAHQVPDLLLADESVIWGHSQGGHAALWAGELADSYAPELDVRGTAALSPASNPTAMAETVLAHPDAAGASLGVAFVVDAYTRYYDDIDVDEVVAPSARTIVREAAARCTGDGGTLVTVLAGLAIARDQPIIRRGALDGPFGDRLDQNIPTGPWPAPLFIGHGEADNVVPFAISEDYVADLCADGTRLEFESYPGGDHMSILKNGSPLSLHLEEWTRARLAGRPAADTCRS